MRPCRRVPYHVHRAATSRWLPFQQAFQHSSHVLLYATHEGKPAQCRALQGCVLMFKAIQPIMLVQPRLHHQFHLRAEYRHSSEVTAAYGVHMHTHLGQKATHRAASVLCNRTVSVLNPSRGYSAPAREFPASFTNLDGTRGILRLGGSDVISFLQVNGFCIEEENAWTSLLAQVRVTLFALQGLLTNDANMLNKPSAQPLYAALLNAQGRYLHDMFLYRTKGMLRYAEVM